MIKELGSSTVEFFKKVLDCNTVDDIVQVDNQKVKLMQSIATIHLKNNSTAKIMIDKNNAKFIFIEETKTLLKKK